MLTHFRGRKRGRASYGPLIKAGVKFAKGAYREYKKYKAAKPSSSSRSKRRRRSYNNNRRSYRSSAYHRGGKTLTSKVRALSKTVHNDMATVTIRDRTTGYLNANTNNLGYQDVVVNRGTHIDGYLSELPIYDPSTNSFADKDFRGQASTHKFHVAGVRGRMVLYNNYTNDVVVELRWQIPKHDHGQNPYDSFVSGIADITGNAAVTDRLVGYDDSPVYKSLWKCVRKKRVTLKPGKRFFMFFYCRPFEYDPSARDSHSDAYQNRERVIVFSVRIVGGLTYD